VIDPLWIYNNNDNENNNDYNNNNENDNNNNNGNQAWSEYKHSLTFRVRRCCRNNEIRAPITNPPNSAQLEGTSYHSQVKSG